MSSLAIISLLLGASPFPYSLSATTTIVARSAAGELTRVELEAVAAANPSVASQLATSEGRAEAIASILVERALVAQGTSLIAATPDLAARWNNKRLEILAAAAERRAPPTRPIPDSEVTAWCEAHRADLAGAERILLRHIFRRVSTKASQAERDAGRADLEAIRTAILAGGDMAALARGRSDSQTAVYGGLLTPQARGALPLLIENAVWNLQTAELSKVLETPVGFQLFRLEQRLPATSLTPAEALPLCRRQLEADAAMASDEAWFSELVRRSGAVWNPGPGVGMRFELGGARFTAADIEAELSGLAFAERRRADPEALLRNRARRELALWLARTEERLENDPTVAAELAAAERELAIELALEKRLDRYRSALDPTRLQAFFAAHPEKFRTPELHRLRLIVRAFDKAHSPHFFFEELAALATSLRAGERDFAAAARELSTDSSRDQGGDVGELRLYDFGLWAGSQAAEAIRRLEPGTISEPLLVLVHDPTRLRDDAKAYLLARVEAIQPAISRTFDQARADVEAAYLADNAATIRAELLAQVRRELDIVVEPAD